MTVNVRDPRQVKDFIRMYMFEKDIHTIADKTGLQKGQVYSVAYSLRKLGVNLPQRRRSSVVLTLEEITDLNNYIKKELAEKIKK